MASVAPGASIGPLAVFRNRNFSLLWLAQLITNIGAGLTTIASSILVYRETGSVLGVGLILLAVALPSLFVGLIAGVFVDRGDRKRIMVICELLRGVLIASLPLLLPYGIGWLYVIVFLSSTVAQFYAPAEASVLPEVATDEELAAANSMLAISGIGATTIGFAAAGLIASQASINWAFIIDAISFVGSAVLIARVVVPRIPVEDDTSVQTVVRQLREGIDVVRSAPLLRSLFLFYIPVAFTFGLSNSLILPFVTDLLHGSEFEYSLFEGFFSVGFVIGCLVMAKLADRLHEGQWVTGSILGMGVLGIGFALSGSMAIALPIFIAVGILNAPSYVGRGLIIQRNTTRDVRGRVSSAFMVTRDVSMIVGMILAGLADVVSTRGLLVACSIIQLVAVSYALRMPGLGQPSEEWRRALAMLRTVPGAPGLGLGRAAMLTDIEILAGRVPAMAGLGQAARAELAAHARVHDAPAGVAVVRTGETGDAAWFLLDGRTCASRAVDGDERILEVHNAGDFFGEIAAVTGIPRTATVMTEQPSTLLQVPAESLRRLMTNPDLNRLFLSKMTERMVRMEMVELPRFAALDQDTLRDLRTPAPRTVDPVVAEQAAASPA
jgi:MFS transporter, DHA3 family, macrolide efflux protein